MTPPNISTLTLVCVSFLLVRPGISTTIAAQNRITLCFHAVLSKDFKVDSKEDLIFIKAGPPIGQWQDPPLVELSFKRYYN